MLVLSRRVDQGVRIDGSVTVRVLGIRNGQVSLGFVAPREVRILREELLRAVARENERAQLAGPEALPVPLPGPLPVPPGAASSDAAGAASGGGSPPDAPEATVRVASRRFGTHDVPLARVLTLDDGLVGFPAARRHAVLDHRPGAPFKWLLCLDEPELGFAIADPRDFVPGWQGPLELAAGVLGCATGDVVLFSIVTIPSPPSEIHLNLLAPVAVDARTRRGCQLVLDGADLDPAYRVPLAPAAAAG